MEQNPDAWQSLREWLVVGATAATALFTGLMALVAWKQARAGVIAEWNFDPPWNDPFFVRVTVRNGLPYSVVLSRVRAGKRFVRDIQPNDREPKHKSWPYYECPITNIREIEPLQARICSFKVFPDWQAVHRQQQHLPARVRRWFAKVAWKSLSGRVHHGASVHFQITIDSNLATSSRKRIRAKIRIPLEAAEMQIAKIEAHQSQS